MDAVGSQFKRSVQRYVSAHMTAGLQELLDYENAYKIIDEALGDTKGMDPSGWSDKGCRALVKTAAASFLKPAEDLLQEIKALLV